ncbi:MAG: ATP-binding protein [Rickettsiaceae bacterium]|nr:ATP-binding protein [Rickettsiaceae bacterium]
MVNSYIDIFIFAGFLIVNLLTGLFYGSRVSSIREYAVGDKRFSTATLTATVIATCIGGGFFGGALAETYRQGLYFVLPAMGEPLGLIFVGYFIIPRMSEFLGNITIAEALGDMYGERVRKIAAISSIALCLGMVSVQFKVSSTILQLFFGVDAFTAVLFSAIIVILYSAFGGIKAVTFTDVIQFFTFGTVIPIISLIIWGTISDPHVIYREISSNPVLDLTSVLNPYNPRFLDTLILFFFFFGPEFQPVFFQRVAMAKTVKQARDSFIFAGIITLLILLITVWISLLILADNPGLDPNNLLSYIINKYSYPGLKGITAVGIMAIIMSSADSYINSAAVILANDLIDYGKGFKYKLVLSRFFSFFTGVIALILALKTSSILELLLVVMSFYSPIVGGPFLLSAIGFRSTTFSVMTGMSTGVLTVIALYINGIDAAVIGFLVNMLTIIVVHYLFRQEGGFVGVKGKGQLEEILNERRQFYKKIAKNFTDFSLQGFLNKNSPKSETVYVLLGIFGLISIFSSMYSMPGYLKYHHDFHVKIISDFTLFFCSMFLTYPAWPKILKNQTFISIAWIIGVPFILVFSGFLLVFESNFGQLQLMIFMINLIIVATLVSWSFAFFSIVSGVIASYYYYSYFIEHSVIFGAENIDLQFQIIYMLLLFTSVLIAFARPQQLQIENLSFRNKHLIHQIEDREQEMVKALSIKYDFLRNLAHEITTPLAGINIASSLNSYWDELSDVERREYTKAIAESTVRLMSFVQNILDFSKLTSNDLDLKITRMNLTELVESRIEECKRLVNSSSELDMSIDLEKNLYIEADEYYITQCIDNIIINAMQYGGADKQIIITLFKTAKGKKIFANLTVSDNGIGIPKDELEEIFSPFIVGSRTKTGAGGRGMGLAVCKKITEVHLGEIFAESDGKSGSKFTLILPCTSDEKSLPRG